MMKFYSITPDAQFSEFGKFYSLLCRWDWLPQKSAIMLDVKQKMIMGIEQIT